MSLIVSNTEAIELARQHRAAGLKAGDVEEQIYWTGFINGMTVRISEGIDEARHQYNHLHAKFEGSDNVTGRVKAEGFLAAINHFGD